MTHLTFEQISELAESSDPKSGHLDECATCRETLRKVRELLVTTQTLPREVAPPPEVWSALRARVVREPLSPRRWWHNGWMAAAAALVLVVGTAVFTSLANPSRGKAAKPGIPAPLSALQSPVVLTVERNYSPTLAQLRQTLDEQRGTLSPATVRTVERSLAVIDSAIAEARAALATDPASQALVDILAAHYERKVDLLQRATELSSSL